MKTNNLKNIIKTILISFSIFFVEISSSFAAGVTDNTLAGTLSFKTAADNITNNVLTSATTLLMTASFVVFFYGVVLFLYHRSNGDDTKLAKDKEAMLWGLLALFVMVSVWGIIKLVQGFFGIQNDNNIQVQSVQFLAPASSGIAQVDPKTVLATDQTSKDFISDIHPGDPITKTQSDNIDKYLNQYQCFPLGIKSIGYGYDDGADSSFVKEFQLSNNLSPTGIIDKATWSAFNNGKQCSNPPTIKAPSQSPYIYTLFYDLKYYNCTNGRDYNYGTTYDDSGDPSTSDLLYTENFQKANGLKVDGTVGDNTWNALLSGTAKKCQ